MSSINAKIYSKLVGTSAVTAVVGAGSVARIYPGVAPIGTDRPCIVYRRVETEHEYALDGGTGWGDSQIEVLCAAETYLNSEALGSIVRAALSGWASAVSPQVQHSICENDTTEYVLIDGSDEPVWITELWFRVRHETD